jgi:lactate 2-monooxygenase
LAAPIFMAPIGVIALCAQDGHGDLATARAAAATDVPMCVSTLVADPMEDVAAELGDTPGLYQLYCPTDREIAESLVHRAEAAGYAGIVVTLDTWIPGWRPRDLATSNFRQLRGHCLANYTSDPVFRQKAGLTKAPMPARPSCSGRAFSANLTWDDLTWLRSLTKLPLILKGICHPKMPGAQSITVSTVSTAPIMAVGRPTADCLPSTACPVWWRPPVTCRFVRLRNPFRRRHRQGAGPGRQCRRHRAALCLRAGARRVDGIVHVLRSLLAEADLIMAVDGYPTLTDLTPDALRRVT